VRIRNIKPSFFTCEDLADVEPMARLLFIGLWCMADGHGRLEDRPRRIAATVFPYESVDAEPLLAALATKRFILRYKTPGVGQTPGVETPSVNAIQIVHFRKHQRPTPLEAGTPSLYAPPLDYYDQEQLLFEAETMGVDTDTLPEYTGSTPTVQPENFQTGSQCEEERVKSNRVKSKGESEIASAPIDWDAVLDEWNALAKRYDLPCIQRITDSRKLKYRLRLEEGFSLAVLEPHIAASQFLREGSWFSWDWLTVNSVNWMKVAEGNYDKSRVIHKPPQKAERVDFRAIGEKLNSSRLDKSGDQGIGQLELAVPNA
jgi:hypothetical protein